MPGSHPQADLAAIFKGLISRRALSLRCSSTRFLRRPRCRAIERPVDMSAGERLEIDRLLSSRRTASCFGISVAGLHAAFSGRGCQRPRERVRIDNGRGASVSPCWMFDTHYYSRTSESIVSTISRLYFPIYSSFNAI